VTPSALLLYTHAASTLTMTGIIWLIQIVHYPLFAAVGSDDFPAYATAHNRLITTLVGPLMITEAVCAVCLVLQWGSGLPSYLAWTGLGLLAIIWISTFTLQVPQHSILLGGFDVDAHRRLVSSNWIRTMTWTIRGLLSLWCLGVARDF
jgi:hypothetical protein